MTSGGFITAITLLVSTLTFLVGLVVFIKDPSNKVYRSLCLSASFFGLWMVANYFSNDIRLKYGTLLSVNRLVFIFSTGAVGGLLLFIGRLCRSRFVEKHTPQLKWLIGSVMLLCTTPLVVDEVMPIVPVTEIVFGILAPVYFLLLVLLIITSLTVFVAHIKKSSGIARARLWVIGWSTISTVSLALVTNAILPFLFMNYSLSIYGPLLFFIMIVGFAYAIIHQRLFDMRLLVLRAVAYTLVVFVLGVAYFLVTHAFSEALISESERFGRISSAIVASALIIAFQPFLHLINTISLKIFYRNTYQVKTVVSEFMKQIALETDETRLGNVALSILQSTLYPQHIHVVTIQNTRVDVLASTTSKTPKITKNLISALSIASAEPLITETSAISYIKKYRYLYDIDLLVGLSNDGVLEGILLLGPKENGSMYSTQDLDLLTICGSTLGLALSNAKKYREIAKFNDTLKAEINKATKKLKSSNLKLKRLDRLRSDFISATSHQLRPQITVASGYMELILDSSSARLNELERSGAAIVLKSIQRMSRIVSGVLEPSLMNSPTPRLLLEKVVLGDLIKQEIEELLPQCQKKDINIQFTDTTHRVKFLIDKEKCSEAVYNLLSNAIQYSHRGDVVNVSLHRRAKQIEFAVADTGIGVTSLDTNKLFSKYFRSSRAKRLRPSGTGIGLYVTKLFVEAHNGNVFHKKNWPHGSVFGFTLPIKK